MRVGLRDGLRVGLRVGLPVGIMVGRGVGNRVGAVVLGVGIMVIIAWGGRGMLPGIIAGGGRGMLPGIITGGGRGSIIPGIIIPGIIIPGIIIPGNINIKNPDIVSPFLGDFLRYLVVTTLTIPIFFFCFFDSILEFFMVNKDSGIKTREDGENGAPFFFEIRAVSKPRKDCCCCRCCP